MNTVLILGAHGRIGAAAAAAFQRAGWRVVSQVRRPSSLPGAVQIPLADTDALAWEAHGARAVLYAVSPVYTDWSQVPAMFDQGLAVTRRLGARLLLPASVYNHGQGMPALIDEHTPMKPSTEKGRMRVALEERLRASGIDATILRAGDFFGAGTGTWLDQLIAKDIGRGRLTYPGPLDVAHAWAYLPDLAQAFVALASRPLPAGVVDVPFPGHAVTGREFLAALEAAADELGLTPDGGWQRGFWSWPLMRALGLVDPMLRELGRMSYLWRVPHALDGRRYAELAGPPPATPLVAALRESLLAMGVAQPALGYR